KMGDLYIASCFVLAFALAALTGARQRTLIPWLVAGAVLRVAMLFLEIVGLWNPPQSTADASRFIWLAHELSMQPWSSLVSALDYRSASSYVVSGAALFKVIGFHPY